MSNSRPIEVLKTLKKCRRNPVEELELSRECFLAARRHDLMAVRHYCLAGAKPNLFRGANDNTALHEASSVGSLAIVKTLLARGADVGAR